MEYPHYDFSTDIWGAGCVMASMIFKLSHLFLEKNDSLQLRTMVKFFGFEDFEKLAFKYSIKRDFLEKEDIKRTWSRQNFSSLVKKDNEKYCSLDAMDLLEKMLKIDFQERITAKEALEHSYFDSVRNYFK